MPSPDRLALMPEATQIADTDAVVIDALEAAGLFPRRVALPDGGHGWRLNDLLDWRHQRQHLQQCCGIAMRP